ncbi:MAG TPA: hypothetical protein VK867_08975 [Candidatus Limnocylindrales bacterium]|nr:hypothetical protein [Candidatus Limnocylindrales bacterium]
MAGQLGYCGLDRRRQPLTGDEIRGCWEAWPAALLPEGSAPLTIGPARPAADVKQPLVFVEVTAAEPASADDAEVAPTQAGVAQLPTAADTSWSLWGDLEG